MISKISKVLISIFICLVIFFISIIGLILIRRQIKIYTIKKNMLSYVEDKYGDDYKVVDSWILHYGASGRQSDEITINFNGVEFTVDSSDENGTNCTDNYPEGLAEYRVKEYIFSKVPKKKDYQFIILIHPYITEEMSIENLMEDTNIEKNLFVVIPPSKINDSNCYDYLYEIYLIWYNDFNNGNLYMNFTEGRYNHLSLEIFSYNKGNLLTKSEFIASFSKSIY